MNITTLISSLVLSLITFAGFSQISFKYEVSVDTVALSSSKALFEEVRSNLAHTHAQITGKHSFEFSSLEQYSEEDIHSLTEPLGSNVINFKRLASNAEYQFFEKNGGQDCPGAAMVCNNSSFSGNASGYGTTQELNSVNDGCLSVEHQSSWYYINVDTPGSLEMTISPDDPNDDYDFAIWGPFTSTTAAANCPPSTAPLRCSYSGDDGDTGMGNYWGCTNYHWFWGCQAYGWITATDYSEGSGGNKWVAPINANSGDVYILLIDNWSTSSQPFDLTWDGTAGLDCTTVPLPVELISFEGVNKADRNVLAWSTASEKNNDYFTLQYSSDGVNWQDIEEIDGAGTTSDEQYYSTLHRDFEHRINYYRLKQVDFNGTVKKHKIISIDNSNTKELLKRVNTLGQEVDENYKGIVIEYYKDGSIRKYFNN